jgi:hypothetical protein
MSEPPGNATVAPIRDLNADKGPRKESRPVKPNWVRSLSAGAIPCPQRGLQSCPRRTRTMQLTGNTASHPPLAGRLVR